MRVVHKRADAALPENPVERAMFFEKEKAWEKAIPIYEQLLKDNPLNESAYNRLMIIHRKEQAYKKEKAVINKAIKAFEGFYRVKTKGHPSPKLLSLSKAFMKSTGLADKKGKLLYQKEPLGKWYRRLEVVEKRLKARS
jgi:tetratricopeptide (TPR) repeat protein